MDLNIWSAVTYMADDDAFGSGQDGVRTSSATLDHKLLLKS